MDILREWIIVLKSYLNRDLGFVECYMNNFVNKPFPVCIKVFNKFLQPLFRTKFFITGCSSIPSSISSLSSLRVRRIPLLRKASSRRRAARISKIKFGGLENCAIGLKCYWCSWFIGFTNNFYSSNRFPFSYCCLNISPSLIITAERVVESAFTHDTPHMETSRHL